VREEERGEVRETQGVVLPLYRAEGEGGNGAVRRWRSSAGAPLMAAAVARLRRLREGKGRGKAAGKCGGALMA
jgi:hypothetical protein